MSDDKRSIPYYAFESAMMSFNKTIKRLWILCIILICLLAGSNLAWAIYESQFEDVYTSIEAEQDGEGINIVGGGDVNYGAEGKGNNENP